MIFAVSAGFDLLEGTASVVSVATTEEGAVPTRDVATEWRKRNPHARALGRLGGLKGGNARAAELTPEERSEIAKKAAVTR